LQYILIFKYGGNKLKTILLILSILSLQQYTVAQPPPPSFSIIEEQTECLNNNNLTCYINSWTGEEEKILKEFVSNKENLNKKLGFLNIKRAKVVQWKELPLNYGLSMVGNLGSNLLEHYQSIKIYYVVFNYDVHKENEFHLNGLNYSLLGVVNEGDSSWKIAFNAVANTNQIISDGYGFGTEDEKNYFERRKKFILN
jgi:hypothetical protein